MIPRVIHFIATQHEVAKRNHLEELSGSVAQLCIQCSRTPQEIGELQDME